jgi:dTDP-4-dehydrorhamnose reductase
MKIIGITGAGGRVGRYLLSHYSNFVDLGCDVTQLDDVGDSLQKFRPDVILHLAAKSDVDWCQDVRNEKTLFTVNVRGTFNVSVAAEKVRVPVVLLSTDHVFSGSRGRYRENDQPFPVNQYGASKYSAEALQNDLSNFKIIRSS